MKKLKELIEKIDVLEIKADLDITVSGVCYDSRKVQQGDVFVAIKGLEFDGHSYIDQAHDRGAACVICEDIPKNINAQYIAVADTRIALAVMSAAWFDNPASKLKIIGVTGTNGKTTVTTLIKQLLEELSGGNVGLLGTNGNFIADEQYETSLTTPESYDIQRLLSIMAEKNCKFAVMEVSSHALSLKRVYGIEFEVGIFTNLTPEHLDFHKTMDAYAKAKAKLFSMSRHCVINSDDEYAPVMINKANGSVFTYSVYDDSAEMQGKSIQLRPNRVDFCALMTGNLQRVEINIPGIFSVYNALATMSAALLVGYDFEEIASKVKLCTGVKGRVEIVPTGKDYTVIIDYAHTENALENVLAMARESAKGRVVTLFGCGGDRDSSKRPAMGKVAAEHSDFVIVTTDNPRTEDPMSILSQITAGMSDSKTPYEVIPNRLEAIHWALDNLITDDILILAGKGHETYQIIGKTKNHFDEREIVIDYLNN